MDVENLLASSPRRLEVPTEGGGETSYELAEDLIASHGAGDAAPAVLPLEGGAVSGRRSRGLRPYPEGVLGPVYRQIPGGRLVVPTGRVLVRFAEGDSAAEHEADLSRAGFRLEEVLVYAPQAAWVRAESGGVVGALNDLGRLAAVAGVEHLEPQLISEAHAR
jgi:hypothetical protein